MLPAWITRGVRGYIRRFGIGRDGAVPGAGAVPDVNKSLRETGVWSSAGASGAPADATYVVKDAHGGLSAERVATDNDVVWDWATAGQAKGTVPGLATEAAARAAADAAHVAAGDPHIQYALESALGSMAALTNPLTTDEDILIRRGGVLARLPKGAVEGMTPRMTGGVIVWTVAALASFTAGGDADFGAVVSAAGQHPTTAVGNPV